MGVLSKTIGGFDRFWAKLFADPNLLILSDKKYNPCKSPRFRRIFYFFHRFKKRIFSHRFTREIPTGRIMC